MSIYTNCNDSFIKESHGLIIIIIMNYLSYMFLVILSSLSKGSALTYIS